ISVFVSQASVMKYFGPKANKVLSYAVASVSGTILAVCSCTVLPLFAGIYMRGAGLGPAIAFLYSGPAINVLAIILTARVLGFEIGTARAIGAVVFSVVIGLAMHLMFRKEEDERAQQVEELHLGVEDRGRQLWQTALHIGTLVGILVFANWGKPLSEAGLWAAVYHAKWGITAAFLVALVLTTRSWFKPDERREWLHSTQGYALQIMPLLFAGVLVSGFLLGRPSHEGLIPSAWVTTLVGGNSLGANLLASVFGAFMYFATLTEVPILQGLLGAGMGKGPALALMLSGPSLSLPSMLVINSILGPKKTAAYVLCVVVMATATGMAYGSLAG
ncbi:MAG: permease, partial [Armatimonadota bacterium]